MVAQVVHHEPVQKSGSQLKTCNIWGVFTQEKVWKFGKMSNFGGIVSYFHPPLPSFVVDLKTSNFTTTEAVKTSNFAAIGDHNGFGAHQEVSFPDHCHSLFCLVCPSKAAFVGYCHYLTRVSSFIHSAFV